MENTTNLKLPLLVPNQSQKEITHNEAIIIIDNILQNGVIDKDLKSPPLQPNSNDLYIVGSPATGEWLGKEYNLAFFDNGWRFISPREGFTFWVNDENCLYSFDGNSWLISSVGEGGTPSENVTSLDQLEDVVLTSLQTNDVLQYNGEKFVNAQLNLNGGGGGDGESGGGGDFGTITNPTEFDIIQHNGVDFVNTKSIQNISMLGVGASADEYNKLSVKSDYVLFDKLTADSRVKVNKATETSTASHLFQNNYSGRAEFGLIGDDNFTLKVSTDGNTWNNTFVVDKASGDIDFKGNITNNGNLVGGGGSGCSLELVKEILLNNGDVSIFFSGLNDGSRHIFVFNDLLSNQNSNLNAKFINDSGEISSNVYNSCIDCLWILDNTNIQHQIKGQNTISIMSFLPVVISDNFGMVADFPINGSLEFYNRNLSGNFIKQFGAYNALARIQSNSGININTKLQNSISSIKFFPSVGSFKSGKIKHYKLI